MFEPLTCSPLLWPPEQANAPSPVLLSAPLALFSLLFSLPFPSPSGFPFLHGSPPRHPCPRRGKQESNSCKPSGDQETAPVSGVLQDLCQPHSPRGSLGPTGPLDGAQEKRPREENSPLPPLRSHTQSTQASPGRHHARPLPWKHLCPYCGNICQEEQLETSEHRHMECLGCWQGGSTSKGCQCWGLEPRPAPISQGPCPLTCPCREQGIMAAPQEDLPPSGRY